MRPRHFIGDTPHWRHTSLATHRIGDTPLFHPIVQPGRPGSRAACRRLCPTRHRARAPTAPVCLQGRLYARLSPSRNALEALNSSAGPHPRHRRTGAAPNPVSASSHRVPFETRKIPGRSRNIPPSPGKSRISLSPAVCSSKGDMIFRPSWLFPGVAFLSRPGLVARTPASQAAGSTFVTTQPASLKVNVVRPFHHGLASSASRAIVIIYSEELPMKSPPGVVHHPRRRTSPYMAEGENLPLREHAVIKIGRMHLGQTMIAPLQETATDIQASCSCS